MDDQVRSRYDAQRDFSHKSIRAGCYAPYVSLLFNTAGDVLACCRSDSYILGNVATTRLGAIWHGERLRAMRRSLQDYSFGTGCEFCEWRIAADDHHGAMAHWFDQYEVRSSEPAYPQVMEFWLSNTCNFACIQCCGDCSSRIRAQRDRLPPLQSPYSDQFFDDLREFLPHINVAKFTGGEPFLVESNYRVWDLMDALQVAPRSHVLTNGSQWNGRVERVLDRIRPYVMVSLDAISTPELLEGIRIGAKYRDVLRNIQRFGEYDRSRGERLAISFSLMRQNWRELGPMLQYCEVNDFDLVVIRLVSPPQFSLFSLHADELRNIADALEAQTSQYRSQVPRLALIWDETIHSLRENASSRGSGEGVADIPVSIAKQGGHIAAARALLEKADWTGAIREAAKASKIDKDYFYALLQLAHAHRRLGQLSECDARLKEAVGLTKRHSSVFIERAWLRWEQGRVADGIDDARAALDARFDSENDRAQRVSEALHILVLLTARSRQASEMFYAIEKWTSLTPSDGQVLFTCGRILSDAGYGREALMRLTEAIRHLAPGTLSDECLALATRLRDADASVPGQLKDGQS